MTVKILESDSKIITAVESVIYGTPEQIDKLKVDSYLLNEIASRHADIEGEFDERYPQEWTLRTVVIATPKGHPDRLANATTRKE